MTDFNAMVDSPVSCDADKLIGLVNDALATDWVCQKRIKDKKKQFSLEQLL